MFDIVMLSVTVVDCQPNNTIILARPVTSAFQQRTSLNGCRLAWQNRLVVNFLAEAHIKDFLTTWKINHGAQWLSATTEDKSKIVEFVLSLDGPSANWFAQNGLKVFDPFEQLSTKLIQLFHRQVPQKDMIG